jgi:hypothetical protein
MRVYPATSNRANKVVTTKEVPRVAVLTVVLAHGPPLPLAQIRYGPHAFQGTVPIRASSSRACSGVLALDAVMLV